VNRVGEHSPHCASSASAIGKSNPEPVLRTSPGARFTTKRCSGSAKPLLRSAACTRTRLSRTAASGRPTMSKPGKPRTVLTSTRTPTASIPLSDPHCTTLVMRGTASRGGPDRAA
jgi:hypothetical protein